MNQAAEKLVREQLTSLGSVAQVTNRYSKERPLASELMTPVNGQSPPTLTVTNNNSNNRNVNNNTNNLVNGSANSKPVTNGHNGTGYANGFESYPEDEGEFIEVKKPRKLI